MGVRLVVLLAVLSIGFVAAGCGGGADQRLSKQEYLQEARGITKDLDATFTALQEPVADSSDFRALAKRADETGDAFEELANRFDVLATPEEIEAAQNKFVAGLRELHSQFHDLAERIRTSPAAELQDTVDALTANGEFNPEKFPGIRKIQEGVEEFKAKGYGASGS